jgi:hypothetical protein
VQPENGIAVEARPRNDVVQHLIGRHDAADHGAEDGKTVMARPRPEDQIQRNAKSRGDEASPLQNADRARQVAEPELVGKGEDQDRVDGHEPQGVEQPRQIGRHTTLLRLQSEVQHVRRVKPEQHKQNQHAGNPETHRCLAPARPSRGKTAGKQKEGQAHHGLASA